MHEVNMDMTSHRIVDFKGEQDKCFIFAYLLYILMAK